MMHLIKKFVYYPKIHRLRKKFTGDGFVYKTTEISLTGCASPSNIFLSGTSRTYGKIVVCDSGKVTIGKYSQLGPSSIIRCVDSICIGDYVAISTNVVIADNNTHPINPKDREVMQKTPAGSDYRSMRYSSHRPIVIGDRCWIGENSRICKGVTIGEGAIVAANAVVTKDVPQNSIVAGNPARVVKMDIDCAERMIQE